MKIPLKMQRRKSLGFYGCRFMWLFALVMSAQLLCAQDPIRVTGTVYDQTGETLPGANVTVVGTTTGTMTDLDGNFSIMVAPNGALQVSFTGYLSQKVNVSNKTSFKITLREDTKLLDEVVVTALGITREAKSLPYSRQAIDTESMADIRASNMLDMLSGKAAGMQVIPGGGPLASTRIVIRGNNSLTGNNQPLFVIDGVPMYDTDQGASSEDLDYGSVMNSINPDEIENIEILKGANAAALYGSDAANGVVLITTKKASRKPGLGVSYGFNMMFGTLYNYPTYQNIYGAGQNGRFERDGAKNYWGMNQNGYTYDQSLPYGIYNPAAAGQDQRSYGMPMLGFDVVGRNGQIKQFSPHKDNVKDMFRTSTAITNSLSIDKVTDGASMRFSYTNIHSDDILENSNKLDRHNFNLRTTAKLTSFFDVDANIRYMYENVDNRNFRNQTDRNPFHVIMYMPRDASKDELIPWKRADGTSYTFNGFQNPYWVLNEIGNNDDKHSFYGNMTFNIKLPYDLSVRLRAATDMNTTQGWKFVNKYSGWDLDGEYYRFSQTWKNNNFDALLSYNKRFNQKLSLQANFGASLQHIRRDKVQSTVGILKFVDMKSLANREGALTSSEEDEKKQKQALYGMASLGYDDWLYVDFTGRNEWSSALPTDNNSYLYFSVGTGVVLTDLIEVDKNILSFAKLRASFAQVGNDTGFDRLYSGYTAFDGSYQGYTYFQGDKTRMNPKLKPEKTQSWEVGTDLRFWDNRISLDLTYYSKRTTDQIVSADAPLASGFEREMINAGEIRNRGAEVTLSVTPIRLSNISWTTTVNWSKNKSKVVALSEGVTRFEMGSAQNIKSYAEVGKPYGVFYGNDYKRDESGNIYMALDGKPIYLLDQYLGTIEPKWFGGWKNSIQIGNFSIGAMIDFQKGGRVWSMTAWQGARDGNNIQSLAGRIEYLWSDLVLRENGTERRGFLEATNTVTPGADYAGTHVLYPDWQRAKGVQVGGTVYDESVDYFGQAFDENGNQISIDTYTWVSPMNHWVHTNASSAGRSIYDASYIKWRELSISYNIPSKVLRNTPIESVRLSAVGRNLAIIHQNTPKGMDPQATSTTGNAQGFEKGFNSPQANYGFDIKISF